MKKVFITIIVFIMPIFVRAAIIDKIPPKVDFVGVDISNYNITKTITDREVIIKLIEKQTNEEYSWSFNKNNVKDEIKLDFNIDFKSKKEEEIKKVTNDSDKLYISFSHHGELPKGTKVKLNVSEKFKDGDILALYYYDENPKKAEFIKDGIKVIDGYVEFEIDHCSEYFLTQAIVNNVEETPKVLNKVIIALTFVVIVVGAYTVFRDK